MAESEMIQTCSDQFATDFTKNVPRDLVSYEGDVNSATPCVQKCLYWYNYKPSSCVVTNETMRLSIRYDGGGDVSFNSATFTPEWIRIFSPSLHMYNGVQAEAELIIEHSPKAASMAGLLVCIPLQTTGTKSGASEILDILIQESPNTRNVAQTVQITDFNINRLLPAAPYFTYSGPLPYNACAPEIVYQYVVYHTARNGGITIEAETLRKLRQNITYSFIVATKGPDTFYNAKGSTANGFNGEDQIYIQCQPAGESEETEVYKEPTGMGKTGDAEQILMSILFVVIGVAFIYVMFIIMKKVMEYVSHTPQKIKIITG